MHVLTRRPKSLYMVEPISIRSLDQAKLDAYAKLINAYNLGPDALDGRYALSLLRAYEEYEDPSMNCIVLKITVKEPDEEMESLNETSPWEALDEEKMALERQDIDTIEDVLGLNANPAMSKNKLKRIAKGNKPNKADQDRYLETLAAKQPPEADLKKEFHGIRALVLLTVIDGFDLCSPLQNRFGYILQRTIGSKSKLNLMSRRMGLIGTHWPMKEIILNCAPTRRPIGEHAAIRKAITDWNANLSKRERCTFIIDPVYTHTAAEKSLGLSGWIKLKLPSSNIVDLRCHCDQTTVQYLKSVKYRIQRNKFEEAGGEFIESTAFTDEECNTIIDMWGNVANHRSQEGKTATLADPSANLIKSLKPAAHEPHNSRSLLFLKLDGRVIASCVIFRLGKTITSDLQGLDYELGRKHKAYLVMMEEMIRIALAEKQSFVDFGPTTGQAKQSIGAKQVHLTGGVWAKKYMRPFVILGNHYVNVE
ncbi:hypothetical protein CANCADRAFT_29435 [Tortispora caseinolytica NRRL Y-17796]|uniref:BioF2-like acetyltransferase domain-containing protein n=1 Tax=Tortispora caseinolytica NRRL Y-17796 TaxID=767744 RepID=A0A1E4TAX2_9ASCO|nr:hypothetical protein CANCADRAFT_29435 [Tortispora caseinolytica NRRL Y-17796]